jgi:transposase
MRPFPQKYSVLVLDNASIHKNSRLRDICEEKGIILEFLPPYSPDYNPVSFIMIFREKNDR